MNDEIKEIFYDTEETNNKWVEEESELKKVYRERDDYKSRVEKAVDYIKNEMPYLEMPDDFYEDNHKMVEYDRNDLLNILQGESNEEWPFKNYQWIWPYEAT